MTVEQSSRYVNEVRLLGRVSAAARERTLPSGDTLVSLRVVVPRPPRRRGSTTSRGASRATVDTFECVAWGKRARSTLLSLLPDEHVVVDGALRRRFWRAGGGVASMVEIDVTRVRRAPASNGLAQQRSPAQEGSARAGSVPAQRSPSPSGQ